jgi:hypothetical protein
METKGYRGLESGGKEPVGRSVAPILGAPILGAALDTCGCELLSWITVAEEAIASGNQATCQVVFDEVLYRAGYSTAESLCQAEGGGTCYAGEEASCD